MQSSGMVGRVKQEIAIHSKLKHPSILELYTFFEDLNYVYLVLELAQNGEFHRYLKEANRVSVICLYYQSMIYSFCFIWLRIKTIDINGVIYFNLDTI